jgi:hypothetical protein
MLGEQQKSRFHAVTLEECQLRPLAVSQNPSNMAVLQQRKVQGDRVGTMILLEIVSGIEYGVAEEGNFAAMAYLLGGTFTRNDPPAVAIGAPAAQFGNLVTAIGAKVPDEGISVVARAADSREVIGALLVEDFGTPLPELSDQLVATFEPVLVLLDQLEVSYQEIRTIIPGRFLHRLLIGVSDNWTGRGIAQEMVRLCLKNGVEKGYRPAFAEATSDKSRRVFQKTHLSSASSEITKSSNSTVNIPSHQSVNIGAAR